MKRQIGKIQASLLKLQVDGFFVSDSINVFYLSGFKGLSEREREAYVLVTKTHAYLFTDPRHHMDDAEYVSVRFLTREKRLSQHLEEIIEKEKIVSLGFEGENLTVQELKQLKKSISKVRFIPTINIVTGIREIKTQEEINKIRKACELSDHCLKDISETIKEGLREKELAWIIEKWIREKGHELAFDPIVAVDQNSAVPHYDTKRGNNKRVKKGSVVLIDFGMKYQDYHSDMTRMFFIGKPNNNVASTYRLLLRAQQDTVRHILKCKKISEIDQFCRTRIEEQGLENFIHSTGHGVGLEVHEKPHVSFRSQEKLQTGQVFTVEPGVYFAGKFGIRIEDVVLIDGNKRALSLTKFPKNLAVL